MYLIDTYLGKDRLPFIEKKEICQEAKIFDSPDKIFKFLNQYFRLNERTEEYIYLLGCDTKGHSLGIFELSHGTVNSSLITPREVYMKALLCGASTIVLAHNHPSGDPTPSELDISTMEKIKSAGEVLSVPLMDFIVCGDNCYYSAKEQGYL